MIINWLSSLPIWVIMIWFFGGAVFYPLGIELAKKYKRVYYLGISMIALITTYTTILLMTADIQSDPVVSIIRILIIAVLVLLMVKWAQPKKV